MCACVCVYALCVHVCVNECVYMSDVCMCVHVCECVLRSG